MKVSLRRKLHLVFHFSNSFEHIEWTLVAPNDIRVDFHVPKDAVQLHNKLVTYIILGVSSLGITFSSTL